MSKIVLRFGLIAAVILVAGMLFSTLSVGSDGSYNLGEIFGYVSMIIALSTIFFGVRKYKELNDDKLTFGRGFLVGISITAIATVFHVSAWLILYNYTDAAKEMMEVYFEQQLSGIKSQDIPAEEINEQVQQFKESKSRYVESVGMQAAMTFFEIFPVGLLLSLVASIVLRKD